MDINVEIIKEELELEEPSVMFKTENESEDIFKYDMTEGDSSIEVNHNNSLHLTSLKKEPDDDHMYESGIDVEKSREKFRSSEENEESVSEIKTEEIMMKSENESNDSKTGFRIHSEGDTDETHASFQETRNLCDLCDYKAHRRSELTTHISVEHEKNSSKKPYQKDHLQTLLMLEHDKSLIKKYGRFHCDYKSNMKCCLINHMHKHNENSKKYGCDHCEFKTHNKSYLITHVLVKHYRNALKKYLCGHCEYKTYSKNCLKSHTLVKHDKNVIKNYGCDHCEYKTHIKRYLTSHLLIHDINTIKKYICEHCDYRTHYNETLKRHVIVKHDKDATKFSCEYCNYKSHFINSLNRHVSKHHSHLQLKIYMKNS